METLGFVLLVVLGVLLAVLAVAIIAVIIRACTLVLTIINDFAKEWK